MWAIEEQVRTLKNNKSSVDKKKFALRFLIHLVGDLHQPLHVGNGLDRGGNDCKVFFHKEKSNLHRLWDEEMINFKRLSYTELVDFISYFSAEEIKEFMGGSLLSWAKNQRIYVTVFTLLLLSLGTTAKRERPKQLILF